MIHLSRFLIGIRHKRIFRFKSFSGQLIDECINDCEDEFNKVSDSNPDESILLNEKETLSVRFNRDDFILESLKIFDRDLREYKEINKNKLVDLAEKLLPIHTRVLNLKYDYSRIGMIFDFKIPVWENLEDNDITKFIFDKFINFSTEHQKKEGAVRFVYRIKIPGGGAVNKLKDFKNVIINLEQGQGIDEDGKIDKCLSVIVDMQHIYDPWKDKISVKEHFEFCLKHLSSDIFPQFKSKGVEIVL
jgi:hypothetical protein